MYPKLLTAALPFNPTSVLFLHALFFSVTTSICHTNPPPVLSFWPTLSSPPYARCCRSRLVLFLSPLPEALRLLTDDRASQICELQELRWVKGALNVSATDTLNWTVCLSVTVPHFFPWSCLMRSSQGIFCHKFLTLVLVQFYLILQGLQVSISFPLVWKYRSSI